LRMMPMLARSWNGDVHNVHDVAEMFTDTLCMKKAWREWGSGQQ
jgi:hypothetical protein